MYCPKCGNENPEDQKYCRSCGLSLDNVSLALSGGASPERKREGLAEIVGREIRGWRSLLIYVALLLVAGLTVSTIGNKILNEKSVSDVGTIIALIGVLVLLLKGLLLAASGPSSVPAKSLNIQAEQRTTELPQNQLPSEPVSVTEHTTRQLDQALEDAQPRSRDTQPGS